VSSCAILPLSAIRLIGPSLVVADPGEPARKLNLAVSLINNPPMNTPRIRSIHAGKVVPLGPEGVPSAFVKHSLHQPAHVTSLGIRGDEQADLSVHGGPEKAVYGYSLENYRAWRIEYPQHADALVPGGFGENLCIEQMRESDLYVGDVHRIGSALLQVCQPRQPCFKLALHFQDKMMPKAMVRSGRAGWYYRVLQPGEIAPDDTVHLNARPNPDFPFTRLVELISQGNATQPELERMQRMDGLAADWKMWARDRGS
jgi:MOSC domain-containing protein YiiM